MTVNIYTYICIYHTQVTIHTDLDQAFLEADVILLLDEWCSDGNDTEEEKKNKVKEMSERYRAYGQLIDTRANKEVKVIVTGSSLVSLRCSLLVEKAHFIDSRQFVAMATQLENEARAMLANKLKVRASGRCCKVSDQTSIAFLHFSCKIKHFSLFFCFRC